MVSQSDQQIITDSLAEFSERQVYRSVFGQQWEEVAELVDPTSRNTFFYGSYNTPGQKKTDRQVDGNAALALMRFQAILDSILTPRNMTWHGIEADNEHLMKSRRVRIFFEQLTRMMFRERYKPTANFSAQNQNIFRGVGAYGNGCLFVDQLISMEGKTGLRYKACPLGEMYLGENHQGIIDSFCRWVRLNGRQAVQKFGKEVLPPAVVDAAERSSEMPFNFLHRVCPNDEYDAQRYDAAGKRYASYYISLDYRTLLTKGGYRSFPVPTSRYMQTPGEVYGRGPAMFVLPAIKTINAEKRDFLTQGHHAAVPTFLTTDDGVVDVSWRPGALNKGGMSGDGKPLVGVLPAGDIQISKEMMDEEKIIIEAAFLTDLFKVLLGDPKVFSATQIVEMMSQRGILIAPTMGRQQSEYLGPMIEREVDVLAELRKLPPLPPELEEAQGEYHVVYTSPLARDMRAQEVAGFTRTLDLGIQVANATGDPSNLDRFDFDTAFPEIARIQSTPESWMASDDQLQAKRQAREKAAQQQQQVQAAPAAAALLKGQAMAAKAGLKLPPNQIATQLAPQQ